MAGERSRSLFAGTSRQRTINEYTIRFRWMKNGTVEGDYTISTGTMDPRQLTQGNQLAMIVVDIPKSSGMAQELANIAMRSGDGETMPVALWAPNGGEGRYIYEREPMFIDAWAMSNKEKATGLMKFWGTIAAFVVISVILSFFIPCFFLTLPVIGTYAFRKVREKQEASGQLSYPVLYAEMDGWMGRMMADGTLQSALNRGLGQTSENPRL